MSIPYVPKKSNVRFHVPKTLAADFDNFLNHDIPNTVMDFELVPNWYERSSETYSPKYIRGEIYPDSTKSRYENTDNNMNFRASKSSNLKKGDMIIDPYNKIYVFDWGEVSESNNISTRALSCNALVSFTRYKQEIVDEDGYLITPEGEQIIAHEIPCNAYRYDGRPEYAAASSYPGISPNALTLMTVQYNDETKNIAEGDNFIWATDKYIVIDVNYVGVNIYGQNGVLKLQARKEPGGVQQT